MTINLSLITLGDANNYHGQFSSDIEDKGFQMLFCQLRVLIYKK